MAYENAYQITNPDCVLLPEEICYMNWQKYYMDYHQHPAGSIEFNYIVEKTKPDDRQRKHAPQADFPGFLHQYEH